jgi:hypothetical protein
MKALKEVLISLGIVLGIILAGLAGAGVIIGAFWMSFFAAWGPAALVVSILIGVCTYWVYVDRRGR